MGWVVNAKRERERDRDRDRDRELQQERERDRHAGTDIMHVATWSHFVRYYGL
jgi:hypothetical protein